MVKIIRAALMIASGVLFPASCGGSPVKSDKLLTYIDYVVEHQLRNDAGIRWVRDALEGNTAAWVLAVRGYAKTIGSRDSGYLAFRRRWAWTDAKVNQLLSSDAGRMLNQRIAEVSKNFQSQPGMSGYTLDHGSLRRSLDTQTSYFEKNWSVNLLGPDLVSKLNKELEDRDYPDAPTEASAKKFYKALRGVDLAPVDNPKTKKVESVTSPTNASPGLSDHGRLSAVDFVVKKNDTAIAGADTADLSKWRMKRTGGGTFEEALKTAVAALNKSAGVTLFNGPLPAPDEPWHYTYLPVKEAEDKAP